MSVYLYVEGGGDSHEEHIRCREGFRKLLEAAGFEGRMPRIVSGGARHTAFNRFKTALRDADKFAILLVDSEEPVKQTPWAHLWTVNGWERPPSATDEQAQLMATCMETWLMADRAALHDLSSREPYPPTQAIKRWADSQTIKLDVNSARVVSRSSASNSSAVEKKFIPFNPKTGEHFCPPVFLR